MPTIWDSRQRAVYIRNDVLTCKCQSKRLNQDMKVFCRIVVHVQQVLAVLFLVRLYDTKGDQRS